MKCRHCHSTLEHLFLDLGFAPPSNAYLTAEQLHIPEVSFPLRLFVCHNCWLVQTEDFSRPSDLFSFDYAYYSSTSKTWLAHAEQYAKNVTRRFNLDASSFVVEIASNDGYLLRNFLAPGIPCLGIEPAERTAEAAEKLGIPVIKEFFSKGLAKELAKKKKATLIIGNNVFAHVPEINNFTLGMKELLEDGGVITLEFPHLLQLIQNNQFDTVYHEHYSYLSLYAVRQIFSASGLRVWDVEELATHGGSLRIYGCHDDDPRPTLPSVAAVLDKERFYGLLTLETYVAFQSRANLVKDLLLEFLIQQKKLGKKVVAYGAAAKGNTLLNYAGVKPDLLPYVCDAALAKQGKYMPGSHIPIMPPDTLFSDDPEFILVLPWNIVSEVRELIEGQGMKGAKFVTAVPQLLIA